MIKSGLFLVSIFFSAVVFADVLKDFDGLGENKDLFDRAKALNPDMQITVVQDRAVSRRQRLEISPEISRLLAGDTYVDSFAYGINGQYHFNPRWSAGVKYTYFTSELNKEGQNLINDTDANGQPIIPDIDYPKSSVMGFINFYPIYGKLNLLGLGITHFDIYLNLGYGSITLASGASNLLNAGGGIGLWWSQHLTTRLEVRYHTYEAQQNNQSVGIDNTVLGVQMGYML